MAENGRREGDTSECHEWRQLINSFVLNVPTGNCQQG